MEKFENIPDLIEKKGIARAEAKARYEYLEEDKKTYLATLMLKVEGSMALREMTARATEDWKTYIDGMNATREEQLKLEAELTALTAQFDYMRSINANERTRINLR